MGWIPFRGQHDAAEPFAPAGLPIVRGKLLPDRFELARLRLDRVRRRAAARALRSPALRWLHPASANELLIVPQDLRTADPSFLVELSADHFGLAGSIAGLAGLSPFALPPPTAEWERELQGFDWLRHFRLAPIDEAQSATRQLVADWIDCNRRAQGIGFAPEVVARRIISWLSHSDLLLEGSDSDSYAAIANSLGAQIRFLIATWRGAPSGLPRLVCLTALLFTGLCVARYARSLPRFERLFLDELCRQVLDDGGHVSRNPAVPIDLLLDCLPLRQCYVAREIEPPPRLVEAIGCMISFLRYLRHGDGTLARFNGMGRTQSDLLATALSYDEPDGKPAFPLSQSRYVRLERSGTIVLVDAGTPPPIAYGSKAHAGCLAFEVSVGAQALLLNCGAPAPALHGLRSEARATSSHNTLTLGDMSSSRLVDVGDSGTADPSPALRLPQFVSLKTQEEEGGDLVLEAAHDGYLDPFGLIHTRTLALAADGQTIAGRDRLGPPAGVLRLKHDLPFAIHFHLVPEAVCRLGEEAYSAEIQISLDCVWRMTATGARLEVEQSRNYANLSGPQSAMQIVLRGACPGESVVEWLLERVDNPA